MGVPVQPVLTLSRLPIALCQTFGNLNSEDDDREELHTFQVAQIGYSLP